MNDLREQTRWKVIKQDGEYVIKGKRGYISQYVDGDINILVTNLRVANKIPNPLHTYDDGADFMRRFEDLDYFCKVIKARKRRHLSPEARQKAIARLVTMRSSKKNSLSNGVSAS